MTAVASTATDGPAWELRLRGAKAQIQESDGSIDITGYLANPESTGIDHQSLNSAEDDVEGVKQHAGKLKEHLTLLRTNSYSDKLKSILEVLIGNHQTLSDDFKAVTDKLQNDRVDKQTALTRVKEAHQRAKQHSNESIDKSMDNAIGFIDNLPYDLQDAAADAWILMSDKFMQFVNKIFNAFSDILNAIAQWPSNVWGRVNEAWNTVKRIFVDIWQWFNQSLS